MHADVSAAGVTSVADFWRSNPQVQGVIKAYDPRTRTGVVMRESDRAEVELAPDALVGSVFRMLRQGQRVVFDVSDVGLATRLRFGSEVDMGAPVFGPGVADQETGAVS